MSVFIDASALVAMIAREPNAGELAGRLEGEPIRMTSGLAAWETMAALSHSHRYHPDLARAEVVAFLTLLDVRLVTIGQREFDLAAQAYARFGKGRHPASLNMGDCFAYACAQANGARLLYIGNDFGQTDIARC